jgi:glycyl-tRNA synthetase beta subunit
MVEGEKIRNNRFALLDGIGQLFLRIADFSKLS